MPAPEKSHPHVLLVDDDPDYLELLRAALERDGLETEAVDRADAALARLERQPFDAIVVDLVLPSMDGWRLAAAIRERRGPRLPIVALSGVPSFRKLSEALLAGANCYIEKAALSPDRIASTVRNAVEAAAS